uniref:Uncharacterized protein n=1 Tax=Arundo donax TaxID=35708 RepID=A0A0A9CLB1_ARUDO
MSTPGHFGQICVSCRLIQHVPYSDLKATIHVSSAYVAHMQEKDFQITGVR